MITRGNPTRHAAPRTRRDPLAANALEIGAVGALVFAYVAGAEIWGEDVYALMNVVGPVWLMAALGVGILGMLQSDRMAIWYAMFWFRVSVIVYYGLGNLVPEVANTETILYISSFFPFQPEHVFKFNLVSAASTLTILSTSAFIANSWRPGRMDASRHNEQSLLKAAVLFGGLGAGAKYLIIVPYTLGFLSFTPPGALISMGLLSHVGLYLLTLYALRHKPVLMAAVAVYYALELVAGTVQLTKSEPILSSLMLGLALLTDKPSKLRICVSAGLIAIVYVTLVPMVDYGRSEMQRRYPNGVGGDFSERLETLKTYVEHGAAHTGVETNVQGAFVRISYVNAGTFAIAEYDSGRAGPSLEYAVAALVPRVLWPDKPILTDVGPEFNERATGNRNSSSSPGLFAEAYWNFGWLGLPLLMVPLGGILSGLSRYAAWIIGSGRWYYFPLTMLALRMGLRMDGWYVADVVGPLATVAFLHVAFRFTEYLAAQSHRAHHA